jgi:hypothetical protein
VALRNGLQFEGQVKPDAIAVDSYENALSAARVVSIPSNQQILIDYVGGNNPIYVGVACQGFATSSGTDNDSDKPNWLIKKITWDANNNPTAVQIGWGKWTNRATTVVYS